MSVRTFVSYELCKGTEKTVDDKRFTWRNVNRRTQVSANSYFEVLGEKASHKKLTEVNGDAVEEEVTISSSIVDGDKALEVLVECFCWGVGLIA